MIDIPVTSEILRGAELELTERGVRPHRLPAWVREQFPDPLLLAMESQPSGLCLAFTTAATAVRLVLHTLRVSYSGAPRPRGSIDVYLDGLMYSRDALIGGDTTEVGFDAAEPSFMPGEDHVFEFTLPGSFPTPHRVEIWLPHNESTEIVSLQADAAVRPLDSDRPVWVHHGSSISHGSNAAAPSQIWPAVAARLGEVELRNLGLGGNAMVDPFMARLIRDTPADLISLKLGINVVSGDVMRHRAFEPAVHGFLDTIRDGHPTTPIVLVSPIYCGIHENASGPGTIDMRSLGSGQIRFTAADQPADIQRGQLTLEVIRGTLEGIVLGRSDPHLRYLDGTVLYGAADAETLPLPDGLHPDTRTHELIGQRFATRVFDAGDGLFSGAVRPGVTDDPMAVKHSP